MIKINLVLKSKLYWQEMADRINKHDMKKVYLHQTKTNKIKTPNITGVLMLLFANYSFFG